MSRIPGKSNKKIYELKWFSEGLSIVPPIVAAGFVAYKAHLDAQIDPSVVVLLVLGIVWLMASSVLKVVAAFRSDQESKHKNGHEGLEAALRVLHAAIATQSKVDSDNGALRATIHRVLPPLDNPKTLEQIVPYIGGAGGGAFRRFPIHCGITGKVSREKVPYASCRQNVDDYEAFQQELVREWAYTAADAKRLTSDRKSWMSVPIFSPEQHVEAVIYLDSVHRDIFTEDVLELTVKCCGAIAQYISARYGK